MKIDSLTRNNAAENEPHLYIAVCNVTSDGITARATGYADDPTEAARNAFDSAAAKFTAQLRANIRVEVSIQF